MYVIQRDAEIFLYYKTLRISKKGRKLLVKILKNLQTEFSIYIKIIKIWKLNFLRLFFTHISFIFD